MKFNLVRLSLIVSFIVFLFSCKRGADPQPDLYYFPEKNAYYDVTTASYYYSLDSAKTWDSMVYNGADFGAALGPKIPLKKPGRFAWSKNDSIRRMHKGRILNLLNPRTAWIAKADSLSRVKPVIVTRPRPVETVKQETEEPPKKGLKKFFSKIFGKRKDKKE
jgi:hypothetical protein